MIKFRGLTSTSSANDDILITLGNASRYNKKVGNKYQVVEPYLAKINLSKGQRVLNCNVKSGDFYSYYDSEVILPKGNGIIRKIDEELNYMEVDFVDI